jgi:hypothetical protein
VRPRLLTALLPIGRALSATPRRVEARPAKEWDSVFDLITGGSESNGGRSPLASCRTTGGPQSPDAHAGGSWPRRERRRRGAIGVSWPRMWPCRLPSDLICVEPQSRSVCGASVGRSVTKLVNNPIRAITHAAIPTAKIAASDATPSAVPHLRSGGLASGSLSLSTTSPWSSTKRLDERAAPSPATKLG